MVEEGNWSFQKAERWLQVPSTALPSSSPRAAKERVTALHPSGERPCPDGREGAGGFSSPELLCTASFPLPPPGNALGLMGVGKPTLFFPSSFSSQFLPSKLTSWLQPFNIHCTFPVLPFFLRRGTSFAFTFTPSSSWPPPPSHQFCLYYSCLSLSLCMCSAPLCGAAQRQLPARAQHQHDISKLLRKKARGFHGTWFPAATIACLQPNPKYRH